MKKLEQINEPPVDGSFLIKLWRAWFSSSWRMRRLMKAPAEEPKAGQMHIDNAQRCGLKQKWSIPSKYGLLDHGVNHWTRRRLPKATFLLTERWHSVKVWSSIWGRHLILVCPIHTHACWKTGLAGIPYMFFKNCLVASEDIFKRCGEEEKGDDFSYAG